MLLSVRAIITHQLVIDSSGRNSYTADMPNLQQLAQSHPSWSLDDFVQVTNALLSQFLPETPANTRVREEVTPRLVRHYSSLEMLDEPHKEGHEARLMAMELNALAALDADLASGDVQRTRKRATYQNYQARRGEGFSS